MAKISEADTMRSILNQISESVAPIQEEPAGGKDIMATAERAAAEFEGMPAAEIINYLDGVVDDLSAEVSSVEEGIGRIMGNKKVQGGIILAIAALLALRNYEETGNPLPMDGNIGAPAEYAPDNGAPYPTDFSNE